jgi:ABC-type lipoprotein export system ATPase subunit
VSALVPCATPLVELEGIGMVFPSPAGGSIEVLRSMTFGVCGGELVVVSGRSGSGKTTLLRIAGGLLRPVAGEVRWNGEAVDGLSADALTKRRATHLGIVFQGAALIETLTAAENVAVPGLPQGLRASGRQRALDLLDEVGAGKRARHFPRQLSGGEQQRVAIARALFSDPPLLVVDEPTANLDRRSADGVIRLLAKQARSGRGLLVASHDPGLIAAADRVVELEPRTGPPHEDSGLRSA